jgi:hypothetical protein
MAHVTFSDGTNIGTELNHLSKAEICCAGHPIKFGWRDHRSRLHLMETVSLLSDSDQTRIRTAAAPKRARVDEPLNEHASQCRKVSQDSEDKDEDIHRPDFTDARFDETSFFKAQSSTIVQRCIGNFIKRTSNKVLAQATCVSCARQLSTCNIHSMVITEIPNVCLLSPSESHPKHQLIDGLLPHHPAITAKSSGNEATVCDECIRNLKKGRIPCLALANNMWIGEVPFELTVLTLPEWVLIARNFPSANIMKLFPLTKGMDSTYCGLRGNVSSYHLDMYEIADMVQGNIMPNPSQILPSTIGVTIIGPKNVRERTMPGFLWVRRHRVRAALVWLQDNNPLYADIIISKDRLRDIAVNGVPEEILQSTRYSDNIEELECERGGYVPEDNELDDGNRDHSNLEQILGAGGEKKPFLILLFIGDVLDI